jgi:hypothetical protein
MLAATIGIVVVAWRAARGWCCNCDDHLHLEPDQLHGQGWELLDIALREAHLDPNVLSIDVPLFA